MLRGERQNNDEISFDLRLRCETIRLNSAIENSKLVEWTVIRPGARKPASTVRNGAEGGGSGGGGRRQDAVVCIR